jgi:indole-3-glycerol phosphate synthase
MSKLDEIVAVKREEVAARKRAWAGGKRPAASPPRGFRRALDAAVADSRFGLIAEIKRASPSKGLIRADFDPPAHARAYREGGASCLSVLTDQPFFQGHEDYLIAARAAVDLPVLRKDFMIDPWQVEEARAIGADAILIIVAALGDGQMQEIEAAALTLDMDVLVEVHDEAELERALALKSRLIGVNNRDLRDFSVDLSRTERLAAQMPAGTTVVAESGLGARADLDRLARHGVRCVLVGESLMREQDVAAATRRLLEGA